MSELKTLSLDQLLGTLIAYEMRIIKDQTSSREASFKAEKSTESELDEIEEKFVRRLKTGSGKYNGKLPFKCFNCGKVGNLLPNVLTKGKNRTQLMKKDFQGRNIIKKISIRIKRKVCV
jgi:hypothetical protein